MRHRSSLRSACPLSRVNVALATKRTSHSSSVRTVNHHREPFPDFRSDRWKEPHLRSREGNFEDVFRACDLVQGGHLL